PCVFGAVQLSAPFGWRFRLSASLLLALLGRSAYRLHTGILSSATFATATGDRLFFVNSALSWVISFPFSAAQLAIRPWRSLQTTKYAARCGSVGAMSPESSVSSWRIIVPLIVANAGGSGTGPGFPALAPRPR